MCLNSRFSVDLQSGGSGAGAGEYPPQSTSPGLQLTPSLDDVQIGKIRDTAAAIVKTLPPTPVESKTPTNKKKISKELEVGALSAWMEGEEGWGMHKMSRKYT